MNTKVIPEINIVVQGADHSVKSTLTALLACHMAQLIKPPTPGEQKVVEELQDILRKGIEGGLRINICESTINSSMAVDVPAPKPPTPISRIGLQTRTLNCLIAENIITAEQLAARSYRDLQKLPNLGRKSLMDIEERLAAFGLHLHDR